jgi:hypothetical protein
MNMSGVPTHVTCALPPVITWGAFSILPVMFGANGPAPVTVQGSLSVEGSVSVEGVVAAINDVLRTPFRQSRVQIRTNESGTEAETVGFDIPARRRWPQKRERAHLFSTRSSS